MLEQLHAKAREKVHEKLHAKLHAKVHEKSARKSARKSTFTCSTKSAHDPRKAKVQISVLKIDWSLIMDVRTGPKNMSGLVVDRRSGHPFP